jgi:carbon storage regulator
MLVLTRRIGERIVIDGGITVTVIKVRGRQVCLGIEAPKEIPVQRAELGLKKQPVAA